MTYVTNLAPGPTELDRVWRLRSQYYELFMTDYHRSLERLDPVLVEVCRLWMATLLGSKLDLSLRYKAALAAGLTEAKIKDLANYAKSPLYSQQEKVCLDFAEQFAIQSSNITDDDVKRLSGVLSWEDVHSGPQTMNQAIWDEARKHFSEQEVVDIVLLAMHGAGSKVAVTLGLEPGPQASSRLFFPGEEVYGHSPELKRAVEELERKGVAVRENSKIDYKIDVKIYEHEHEPAGKQRGARS